MTLATSLRASAVSAALLLAGCHTGSANTLLGAASITSLALGAAAVSRASGGCVAICTNGTVCNEKTGLCRVLPCRGQCDADEHCEDSFTGSKCVPGGTTGVATASQTGGARLPVAAPWVPESSGPPIVVPKAEQQPTPSQGEGK